jgi:ribosomal protein L16 Arg81 hydroxylase
MRTLADLLAPITPERFLAQHWERRPLHISRTTPGYYDPLLTKQTIDTAIASGGLRFPGIQLAKGGGFVMPEAFTRSIRAGDDIFTGVPILERVREEYQSGATISLPGFHRAWPPLGALTAAIEAQMSHPVHTNIYLTPGAAAGFTPHFDTHEVFVLQIAGTKHWVIYPPPIELPHRSQPFDPRLAVNAAPLLEFDLTPGDLLYLPRGFVHTTTTPASFSLHVTLGITVYTWVELLADWAHASRHDPALRHALPPGFASGCGAPAALKAGLHAAIARLQQTTDLDALLDRFTQRVNAASNSVAASFDSDVSVAASPAPDRASRRVIAQ